MNVGKRARGALPQPSACSSGAGSPCANGRGGGGDLTQPGGSKPVSREFQLAGRGRDSEFGVGGGLQRELGSGRAAGQFG